MKYNEHLGGRFTHTPRKGEQTIVGIPGGPFISGKYMDALLVGLNKYSGLVSGTLNLPNHDENYRSKSPQNFDEIINDLKHTIQKLVDISGNPVIAISHSFGAFLNLGIALESPELFKKLFVINTPSAFIRDKKYPAALDNLRIKVSNKISSEVEFKDYWQKILPLYFTYPLLPQQNEILTKNTFFSDNSGYEVNKPKSINHMKQLFGRHFTNELPIVAIESENDLITPTMNIEILKDEIAPIQTIVIANSGHFPMLDQIEILKKVIITNIFGAIP